MSAKMITRLAMAMLSVIFALSAGNDAGKVGREAMAAEGAKKASTTNASSPLIRHVMEVPFDDALFDLEEAITGKGLKITYRADIASMLERTGKDLGFEEKIFRGGVVLQFCSAKLSYQAMKADPANIAFCPYGIFLYETEKQPGKSVVGYRPLPTDTGDAAADKARAAINALLDSIVREAAGK